MKQAGFAACFLMVVLVPVLSAAGPQALVRVGRVEKSQVESTRLAVGRVEPARRSVVAAEEPGRVVLAPPEPGTAAAQGAVVARIDTWLLETEKENARAQVLLAEAQVAEREAQLEILRRNRERLEELVAANVATEKELSDLKGEESAAAARLRVTQAFSNQARTSLARYAQQLEKSQVLSPFDAFVVLKHTEVGQWLKAGDPVVELVQIDRVKVRIDVPQEIVGGLQPGTEVGLRIDAAEYTCRVPIFSIVPDADPQSRAFRVLFKLENPDRRLMPGMSVLADVPDRGEAVTALTVPRDAVITLPSGRGVFVADQSQARFVRVEVLQALGDRYAVGGLLEEGQQVVIQGNERLRDGQPLQILPEAVSQP